LKEITSHKRNSKSQIPNSKKIPKFNIQTSFFSLFGYLELEIYLEFGAWNLEFFVHIS